MNDQCLSTTKERLIGILEGLECQNIDDLIEKSPEHLRRVGMEIAKHAKVGAFHADFVTSLMKNHFGAKQDVKEQRHGNISTKDRG